MNFDHMNEIQRRLHNAACVLGVEFDDYGFAKLQRDAIAAIADSDALHRAELAAYELTVNNLRAELAKADPELHRAELAAYELTVNNLRAELAQARTNAGVHRPPGG